jgi:hypothetical protein
MTFLAGDTLTWGRLLGGGLSFVGPLGQLPDPDGFRPLRGALAGQPLAIAA